jgi:putative ABC transport system permease protein
MINRLNFYLRYALRSLRRDGTRTFLAGLSVAFGVLSLISMQLLSNALLRGEMFDQRIQYGGDAQIWPASGLSGFTPGDLEQIETWHQDGLIAGYTPVSDGSAAYMRTADSGRAIFLSNALGIDPAGYPLTGKLILREPSGATAGDVLRSIGDAIITRDIADQHGLRLGDTILLSGDSAPAELRITGIASATPTQQGDMVFYGLDTARLIEGRNDVINSISINWGAAPGAEQTVIDSEFNVYVAASRVDVVQSSSGVALFDLMLKGAGVLGLLVGGLSVSNTLQVILARRKLEIAMLKTLGYRQPDLLMLMSLESGLTGLAGGLAGALAGVVIAGKLIDVLGAAGSLMLDWHPDPLIVTGGVITGILTAVVFGIQAILTAGSTRPIQLLRDMPGKPSRRLQSWRIGVFALMLLVFGVLVGIVLGSPLEGILYVFVGGLLILLLRSVFWGILWLVLRLPIPAFPLLRLSRANLRQRKTQASLTLMALFAGAFSVTFAVLALYNAQAAVAEARGSDSGYNLMVFTTAQDARDAVSHMILQGAEDTYIAERASAAVNGEEMVIEGREASDIGKDILYGGALPIPGDTVLLPEYEQGRYAAGDILSITLYGTGYEVTLTGFYSLDPASLSGWPDPLIVPSHIFQTLGSSQTQTRVIGAFPVPILRDATDALGQALPNALVFSRADLNDAMTATYQALFTFAGAIAGLAFVAGAVLIANAAGLTVIERRREIGIFKAVGYTSGHVLRAIVSEYGILGTLAGISGVTGAVIALELINLSQPGVGLISEPLILAGMLALSIVIAVSSAAVVVWQPTRVRPLDVLRYE